MKTAMKRFLIGVLVPVMSVSIMSCAKEAPKTSAEQEPAADVAVDETVVETVEVAEVPAAADDVSSVESINGSWKSNAFESMIGNIYICLEIDDEKFVETVHRVSDDGVIEVNEGTYEISGEQIKVAYPNMQGMLTVYNFVDGVLSGGQYVYERVG